METSYNLTHWVCGTTVLLPIFETAQEFILTPRIGFANACVGLILSVGSHARKNALNVMN